MIIETIENSRLARVVLAAVILLSWFSIPIVVLCAFKWYGEGAAIQSLVCIPAYLCLYIPIRMAFDAQPAQEVSK